MGFVGSILLGVVCLTVVILLLIGVLMFAESKLVQKGNVKITINGDDENSPEVAAGGTLLSVLGAEKQRRSSFSRNARHLARTRCDTLAAREQMRFRRAGRA